MDSGTKENLTYDKHWRQAFFALQGGDSNRFAREISVIITKVSTTSSGPARRLQAQVRLY